LQQSGIRVSLFIDAEEDQIHAAADAGSEFIEIHTGHYANAQNAETRENELMKITRAARLGASLNLKVNAGHGLNYHNVQSVAAIPEIQELNIGHSIIARAVFSGMAAAVTEIKTLIREARR
jgi:pyridoxine 5-phosphate synthase